MSRFRGFQPVLVVAALVSGCEGTTSGRAYYSTIVRANLISLAHAESAYYSAHFKFTRDLASLRPREDGTQFRFTSGMVVTITLYKTTDWEATGKNLGDTAVVCSIRGFVREGIPRSTQTHCPRLEAVPLPLEGGLSLHLPLGWAVRDSTGLSRWTEKVDSSLRTIQDSVTREPIDSSRGRLLLVAHGPDGTTLTLGVSPAAEVSPQTFGDFTPREREEYRTQVCEFVQSMLRNLANTSARCGQLRADSISDRDALLFEYEHEDGGRQIHVWLVRVATAGAIVSLSFLAGVERANDYEPTFRRVWRSLSVPARLRTKAPNKT